MTQLVEMPKDGNLVAYRPGIPAHTAARGVLRRFIPGSAGIMSVLSLASIVADPTRAFIVMGIVAFEVTWLAFGYGVGLELLRRWLYPDAAVDGRRSVVAGLMTPLALGIVSVFTQGAHTATIGVASTLVGLGMAAVMFFAWLRPTPDMEATGQYQCRS